MNNPEDLMFRLTDEYGFDGVMALMLEHAKYLASLPGGNPARKELRKNRIQILQNAHSQLLENEK